MNKKEKEDFRAAIRFAKGSQMLKVLIWGVFYPKRVTRLINYLNQGMSWHFAYKKAKSN